ncbi:uncharacterized protein LOC123689271 [Pieris rapae]|uniref:uncharacterized protein LOC123689271 n=1 Tax=Pieris rapae TaxID=64459 RepID=UPI001E27E66B|nr:uncharacterized protein LOC123689271 [Pieris rapae]
MFCEIPDFGRCCFCLPLRQGILAFGYINVIFSAFMTGVYSYTIHNGFNETMLMYHGSLMQLDDEICLVIYIFDFLFALGLVYGGHTKNPRPLKVFYYYAMTTLLTTLILQINGVFSSYYPVSFIVETCGLFLLGICLHLYLIFMVRSLLKKLETSGQSYENQLHQIVNGEIKVDTNGVYPSTVLSHETE